MRRCCSCPDCRPGRRRVRHHHDLDRSDRLRLRHCGRNGDDNSDGLPVTQHLSGVADAKRHRGMGELREHGQPSDVRCEQQMRSGSRARHTGTVAAALVLLVVVAACAATTTGSTTPIASPTPTASATPAVSAASSPTPEPPAGWVSYHSTVNQLTFFHPAAWQPVECNGVTAIDNATPTCTPGEGPAATLTVFADQGLMNDTGGWPASTVSVNGAAGRCFTDSRTTQTPAPDSGPVLAYASYTVCDVPTGIRVYHFTFIVPPTSERNPSDDVTQSQFEQFLRTVRFDS